MTAKAILLVEDSAADAYLIQMTPLVGLGTLPTAAAAGTMLVRDIKDRR
jgi:hypothetical protein